MAEEAAPTTQAEPKLDPKLCSFCGKGDYPYRVQSTEHPDVSICFPCCHEVIGMLLTTTAELSAEKTKREEAEQKLKEEAAKKAAEPPKVVAEESPAPVAPSSEAPPKIPSIPQAARLRPRRKS